MSKGSTEVPALFFKIAPRLTAAELRVLTALLAIPDGLIPGSELCRRTGINRNACYSALESLQQLTVLQFTRDRKGINFLLPWRGLWGGPSVEDVEAKLSARESERDTEGRRASLLIAFYMKCFKERYYKPGQISDRDARAARLLVRRLGVEKAKVFVDAHLPPGAQWPRSLLGLWDRWKAENQEKPSAVHRAGTDYSGMKAVDGI